jgi:hypothetical protein
MSTRDAVLLLQIHFDLPLKLLVTDKRKLPVYQKLLAKVNLRLGVSEVSCGKPNAKAPLMEHPTIDKDQSLFFE